MLISNPFKKDFWSFYNFEIVKATVNKSVGGPSRKEFFIQRISMRKTTHKSLEMKNGENKCNHFGCWFIMAPLTPLI